MKKTNVIASEAKVARSVATKQAPTSGRSLKDCFVGLCPPRNDIGTFRSLCTLLATTLLFLLTASACTPNAPEQATVLGRWYTAAQVEFGESLYQVHCAACHAADGSAIVGWRQLDTSGHYPPPPLNGTAHTWHHPLEMLDDTIANGGVAFGGVMPGFAESLSSEERLAVIAWFQSLWPDEIYERWNAIEERSRN